MGRRHPNHRRVRIHLTYSVEELARLFEVHKNTIRNWEKTGLQPIDNGRPVLFKGYTVASFLKQRRDDAKRPCGPGQLYCLPCRSPRRPDGGFVDYLPLSATAGNLRGICPVCDRLIHRRVNRGQLAAVAAGLDIQFQEAKPSQ